MNPITKTTTQQVNASLFSIQSDINKTNGLVKEVQVLYNDLKAEGKIIDDNLQAQIDSINTQITTINGSLGTIGGQISAINTSLSNKVDNSRVVQTLSDSSDTIPSCAAVNGALTNVISDSDTGYTIRKNGKNVVLAFNEFSNFSTDGKLVNIIPLGFLPKHNTYNTCIMTDGTIYRVGFMSVVNRDVYLYYIAGTTNYPITPLSAPNFKIFGEVSYICE